MYKRVFWALSSAVRW